jgi:hypothetical protein
MKNVAARYCAASWFGLVLVLMLGANSCKEEPNRPGVTGGSGLPQCGPKKVIVDTGVPPKTFVDQEAVYVCEGDIVTWEPASDAVQSFEVEFKDDYPFNGAKKKFHKGDGKSPATKPQPVLKVYPYKITVNGQPYGDPQVVGGGGNK